MKFKIYIQSFNNFPIADWALFAYMGFKESQSDIVLFEDIEEVPASKWHLVVASIEDTNKYLKRLGIPPKMALNIPEEIEKYTGRQIVRNTLGWIRHEVKRVTEGVKFKEFFIKPNGRSKEFIAGIVENPGMMRHFNELPDSTPVLVSEVVNFVSEYRGYVVDRELVGLYWYKGDFRVFPDVKIIDAAISDYKSAPAGYSIDFGVTDDGRTLLIECNDGWALGNYGLEPSKYCRLLYKRWLELVKTT